MIRTRNEDYIVKDNSNTQYIKLKLIEEDSNDCGMILHISKLSDEYNKNILSAIDCLSSGEYVEAELKRKNKNHAWEFNAINKIYD